MMRKKQLFNRKMLVNNRGSLLIISFFVITLLLGMGAAFMLLVTQELRLVERQRLSTVAFYIAEAGIERGLYDLRLDFENDATSHPWANGFNVKVNGVDVGVDFDAMTQEEIDNGVAVSTVTFHDGTYDLAFQQPLDADLNVIDDALWIKSTGTAKGVTSTIEAYVKIIDLNPWNNAIFAGVGQLGSLINGNVDIRGSVFILGDDDLPVGVYAVDIGGTAEFVGNNYRTMPAALKALVPKIWEDINNNGVQDIPDEIETLNATLRVKNGIVGVSGNSSIGEADISGDAYKETIDGVYVSDGFGGNKGASQVYSDNGTSQAYDLGDSMTFPLIRNNDGSYTDLDDTNYVSYKAYLEAKGETVYTLSSDDVANKLNNLSGGDFEIYEDPEDEDSEVIIEWAGDVLTIKDDVVFYSNYINEDGDTLTLDGPGPNGIIYEGSASFLVEGNVVVNSSFVTRTYDDNGDDISDYVSYPYYDVNDNGKFDVNGVDGYSGVTEQENIIGFMTPGTITLGDNAQIDIMGMFYAQTKITINKQTDVVGSIVSNFFDMGTNVPALYQVPEAANNLPAGIIGGENTRWYAVTAWIKR